MSQYHLIFTMPNGTVGISPTHRTSKIDAISWHNSTPDSAGILEFDPVCGFAAWHTLSEIETMQIKMEAA